MTHLQWGAVAYPPQTKAEASVLERAQNKATNLVNEFRGVNFMFHMDLWPLNVVLALHG